MKLPAGRACNSQGPPRLTVYQLYNKYADRTRRRRGLRRRRQINAQSRLLARLVLALIIQRGLALRSPATFPFH